jgi:hypothetical protein
LITNTGRTILAKYLIGQAPAYASHIALGVGSTPLSELESFDNYSEKRNLDFEVLRIPISSRGYVYDEAGVANIVFAGELPGDQRYLFSEIGIFSAKSNPAAGTQDSRMIYTFSQSENWEYHNRTTASTISTIVEPLNGELEGSIINPLDETGNPVPVFRTNSNNVVFNSDARANRYELPRFLDRALLVSGDMSYIEETAGDLSIKESTELDYYATHLHLTGITTNFNRNSAEDQFRLAFSIVDKDAEQSSTAEGRVGGVRIIFEFASSDVLDAQNFARFEVDLDPSDVDFITNRYIVVTKTLSELKKSASFTWNTINVVKIYAMVYDATGSGTPSDKFYIALDGFRLENVTSQNPLYGMTGYTVIKTEDGQPVAKEANSSNIVEFRYGLDVA